MGRSHCTSLLLIFSILLVFDIVVSTDTVNIATILDVTTPAGKAANTSLRFALQDINYQAANGTRFNLIIEESRGFVGNVLQVFRSEVAAILVEDPKISKLLGPLAEEVHVPILSFSGAHGFGTSSDSTYLISTFPSRYDDMKATAAIAAYFQWKSAVVLYEDDEFWINGVYGFPCLDDGFKRSYKTVGFCKRKSDTELLQSPRKEENKLGGIIWPGDTTQAPNGYRKIVIGKVTAKKTSNLDGFLGRISNYTNDTFQAVVDTLPYNLPFVYKTFENIPNYDELVAELVDGNTLDAVVGDSTILWDRSLYVDFTQPYTQTGLVMMIPLKKAGGRTWTFLHPFTTGLWVIAGAFVVFTAFLVWLMEHQDNHEFQGGVIQQVVTSLTLAASAFLFAHREEVRSSLGKGIVATWLLIALVLNNSYTAHLTSILTVQRWVPTITKMESLTTSNVKVGYLDSSFVKTYLKDNLNISPDRLVPLDNPNDYVQKLMSEEVGAIVDESLYVKIVKSLYPCAKFEVVDRGYIDTGGFGFFFREGSPFLSDVSKEVLDVSEQPFTIQSISNKCVDSYRQKVPSESAELGDSTNTICQRI
ncbi:glutamate receptor 3.5-like [Cryptomeria japonica]|uniref:glutamate receptor 3.5-like n=1 Tax=Cryptomeria japonica TaxID=3369 RepID=UPI0027DA3C11|nr:glutamate receptor 3.5-like [Cryptomeria japonica]